MLDPKGFENLEPTENIMATVTLTTRKNNLVVAAAWGFMLLASILPEIILVEVLHRSDLLAAVIWVRLVVLAVLTAVSRLWQPLRPLWKYAAILFIFAGGQEVMNAVRETAVWQNSLNQWGSSFARDYLAVQVWKLGSTAIVLVGLFGLGFRRKDAFLVRAVRRAHYAGEMARLPQT
jgi:hypothetical protein